MIARPLTRTGDKLQDSEDLARARTQATDAPEDISSDDFFRRAKALLNFAIPPALTDINILPASGDAVTDRIWAMISEELPLKSAAVLIPVVDYEKPTVLLTQRTQHLSSHAGQIAFPGGKIDPEDASPIETALRETEEEIGLPRSFIEPIGYLDLYITPHGYRILPVLARVRPGFELTINPDEVEDAFEVPLSFLMDPANHMLQSREFNGLQRQIYEMPFGERHIWGVTAGMLRTVYERIVLR